MSEIQIKLYKIVLFESRFWCGISHYKAMLDANYILKVMYVENDYTYTVRIFSFY